MFHEFIVLIISVNNNISVFSFFHETCGIFFYSFTYAIIFIFSPAYCLNSGLHRTKNFPDLEISELLVVKTVGLRIYHSWLCLLLAG